jgi:hypothetical protein
VSRARRASRQSGVVPGWRTRNNHLGDVGQRKRDGGCGRILGWDRHCGKGLPFFEAQVVNRSGLCSELECILEAVSLERRFVDQEGLAASSAVGGDDVITLVFAVPATNKYEDKKDNDNRDDNIDRDGSRRTKGGGRIHRLDNS